MATHVSDCNALHSFEIACLNVITDDLVDQLSFVLSKPPKSQILEFLKKFSDNLSNSTDPDTANINKHLLDLSETAKPVVASGQINNESPEPKQLLEEHRLEAAALSSNLLDQKKRFDELQAYLIDELELTKHVCQANEEFTQKWEDTLVEAERFRYSEQIQTVDKSIREKEQAKDLETIAIANMDEYYGRKRNKIEAEIKAWKRRRESELVQIKADMHLSQARFEALNERDERLRREREEKDRVAELAEPEGGGATKGDAAEDGGMDDLNQKIVKRLSLLK